ncbi:hypothetical protein CpipJ_CPIJ003308 [Culex quinquefasciatus]|uniref:Uncharacterized protein n=1 Tax=Culex quinquefasciatus TaxID=7176 RepID=B0W8K0_CULQU|nr:hypothetical protein CpipJ_CPIJ003308 [Culex quinquefasciatus]|eukprot:XP_001845034.1 hypothetical protein CpipJ_CPIJ003308 [Culex quinquefasciatus]
MSESGGCFAARSGSSRGRTDCRNPNNPGITLMAILPSKKHNRCNPVITPGTGRSVNDRGL